jgi:hypothetical protein
MHHSLMILESQPQPHSWNNPRFPKAYHTSNNEPVSDFTTGVGRERFARRISRQAKRSLLSQRHSPQRRCTWDVGDHRRRRDLHICTAEIKGQWSCPPVLSRCLGHVPQWIAGDGCFRRCRLHGVGFGLLSWGASSFATATALRRTAQLLIPK